MVTCGRPRLPFGSSSEAALCSRQARGLIKVIGDVGKPALLRAFAVWSCPLCSSVAWNCSGQPVLAVPTRRRWPMPPGLVGERGRCRLHPATLLRLVYRQRFEGSSPGPSPGRYSTGSTLVCRTPSGFCLGPDQPQDPRLPASHFRIAASHQYFSQRPLLI